MMKQCLYKSYVEIIVSKNYNQQFSNWGRHVLCSQNYTNLFNCSRLHFYVSSFLIPKTTITNGWLWLWKWGHMLVILQSSSLGWSWGWLQSSTKRQLTALPFKLLQIRLSALFKNLMYALTMHMASHQNTHTGLYSLISSPWVGGRYYRISVSLYFRCSFYKAGQWSSR